MASNSITIDTTMGAAYIGVVVAAILYGVTFVQSWYYFVMYRKDVWYIKTLVGAIWAAETVHQALISHTVYHYVVTNYNRPKTLDDVVWSVLLEVLFNGLIGLLVQGFLALRVWRHLVNRQHRVADLHLRSGIADFDSRQGTYPDLCRLLLLSGTANSVLATLNARQSIRDLGETSDDLSFSLQTVSKSANAGRSTNISIKIDTMQDFLKDPRRPSDDPTEAGCEATD
ncbi:hypothetical protein D9619_000277 [Psilocybe cf. subviscida]|uniref:Uncharacterized protein n=1 Tax=Psilocybe cf. subviscida TaxID=2480587 RepID=A0A8H5F2D4_9AGAR|nr:hypothetical protein D9619_000277 [Psilocybe cf. subviscida]